MLQKSKEKSKKKAVTAIGNSIKKSSISGNIDK